MQKKLLCMALGRWEWNEKELREEKVCSSSSGIIKLGILFNSLKRSLFAIFSLVGSCPPLSSTIPNKTLNQKMRFIFFFWIFKKQLYNYIVWVLKQKICFWSYSGETLLLGKAEKGKLLIHVSSWKLIKGTPLMQISNF